MNQQYKMDERLFQFVILPDTKKQYWKGFAP